MHNERERIRNKCNNFTSPLGIRLDWPYFLLTMNEMYNQFLIPYAYTLKNRNAKKR